MPEEHKEDTLLDSVALLVVDMQETFLKAVPDRERLLRRCQFAVKAASLLSLRVIFTEQNPEKLGPVHPSLFDGIENPGVFSKTGFSALQAPGLRETLEKFEINHLIVAGLETSICVYQTAIEGTNDDLSLTILSDCVGARRADDSAVVLTALRSIGCHVLPSETVFYSILADSQHPKFRAFTSVVKSFNQ